MLYSIYTSKFRYSIPSLFELKSWKSAGFFGYQLHLGLKHHDLVDDINPEALCEDMTLHDMACVDYNPRDIKDEGK